MHKFLLQILLVLGAGEVLAQSASATATSMLCSANFTATSVADAFQVMTPGWNLGNTLEATPTEGSWNNPPVQPVTFQQIKTKGFNSVRIPVTWIDHFIDGSPTWNVNVTWMDRVETVVDEALSTGLWVIINAHHDATDWADVSAYGANYTEIEEKFGRLWAQISERFSCKSAKLIFEPLNEPPGTTQEHGDELNVLNGIFLTEVNNAGGNNPQRVVTLSGLGMDGGKTVQFFQRGSLFPNQPWGLQIHYYSPYDFIFDAWGKTIWGSDADKSSLVEDFANFAGNFTGIPTLIGEWGASTVNTETTARWKYFDFFTRTALEYGFPHLIWDNGLDHFDRTTDTWRDPVAIDILFNAVSGINNTLADSTTSTDDTAQFAYAFLFKKVGEAVSAQSATYILNGNNLTSIANSAGTLLGAADYSMNSDGTLDFSESYLSTLWSTTDAAGIKDTLTLTFSAGAALTITIVEYDTPTAPQTTYSLSTLSTDTTVPLNYMGLPVVAAVKAVNSDGTYLQDSWTVWLDPLQQGRWTQGYWYWSDAGFIIYEAGLSEMQATGLTVTLTLEFYPRSLGQNSLNLTFTQ